MAKTRLAVLYGGRSAEHQVSVVSARSVMEALDPDRFEVVPVAITREGAWLLPDRSPLELTAPDGSLPEVEAAGRELAVRPEHGGSGGLMVSPPEDRGPTVRRSASSASSRLLPIPASPTMVTSTGPAPSPARAAAASSAASSRSRATRGGKRRLGEAGPARGASAGHAGTGSRAPGGGWRAGP
jgi:hypothetical protein